MAKRGNNSNPWLSILIAAVVVAVGVWVLARGALRQTRNAQDKTAIKEETTAYSPPPAAAFPATVPVESQAFAPTPKSVPEAAAPVSVDPIAWLLEHKEQRPKEVTLTREAEFPVVIQGKVSGSAMVPAGTVVELVELGRDHVAIVYRGGGTRVPVATTDLERHAEAAMKKFAAESNKTASASAESAKPAAPTSSNANSFPAPGRLLPVTISGSSTATSALLRSRVILAGNAQFHITGAGDPLEGSVINFTSPDAWLFLDKIRASDAIARILSRIWVNGVQAEIDSNLRITQYGAGCVIIPHGLDFAAMSAFGGQSLTGTANGLKCFTNYNAAGLGSIRSFRLKRGYMATIAQNDDGTGVSRNYVAQDSDLEIKTLPGELDGKVRFVRIFPWRFTSKKGIAGGIWQNLNVGWFYDWNIGAKSSPELEYVPIKQKRWWPGLKQDWRIKGATHLLGFNEPDRPDQANMKVDEAIAGWPELMRTGLRLGTPAVSDGGLGWLYEFIDKADAANLRVDFVAVHYYRAVAPSDAKGAAKQFHSFLKGIHDRTKRPIWITEWNNGANWTNAGDPNDAQQKKAIAEMIEMLDETDFVERYALYNWVEDCRALTRKDGSLTPAGEVYRDKVSPLGYRQRK